MQKCNDIRFGNRSPTRMVWFIAIGDICNFIYATSRERNLTHGWLATPKRVIGKQCRPRSDAADIKIT